MKSSVSRSFCRRGRKPAILTAAGLVILGVAAACDNAPTELAQHQPSAFGKVKPCTPWPSCNGDGGSEDPALEVTALVTDPSPDAGVYSDNSGAGYAIYTPEDGVTTRVDLDVLCTREIRLVLPGGTGLSQIIVDQITCNPEDWVFLRLADLTDKSECATGTCWPSEPSYTTNRNGKVRPTGAFAPNLHYFFSVPGDAQYDFVWTDGTITQEDPNGTANASGAVKHVTASNAHLYRGGINPVCAPDPAPDSVDKELCPSGEARVDFSLALDVKVVEGNTWPGP